MIGYVMLKYVQIDYIGDYILEYKGFIFVIQFCYVDVLLNYVEVLVEKNGVVNVGKIIEILYFLCECVGMLDIDFDCEYNIFVEYLFRNLDKYI